MLMKLVDDGLHEVGEVLVSSPASPPKQQQLSRQAATTGGEAAGAHSRAAGAMVE
jgi:hypothetical protein